MDSTPHHIMTKSQKLSKCKPVANASNVTSKGARKPSEQNYSSSPSSKVKKDKKGFMQRVKGLLSRKKPPQVNDSRIEQHGKEHREGRAAGQLVVNRTKPSPKDKRGAGVLAKDCAVPAGVFITKKQHSQSSQSASQATEGPSISTTRSGRNAPIAASEPAVSIANSKHEQSEPPYPKHASGRSPTPKGANFLVLTSEPSPRPVTVVYQAESSTSVTPTTVSRSEESSPVLQSTPATSLSSNSAPSSPRSSSPDTLEKQKQIMQQQSEERLRDQAEQNKVQLANRDTAHQKVLVAKDKTHKAEMLVQEKKHYQNMARKDLKCKKKTGEARQTTIDMNVETFDDREYFHESTKITWELSNAWQILRGIDRILWIYMSPKGVEYVLPSECGEVLSTVEAFLDSLADTDSAVRLATKEVETSAVRCGCRNGEVERDSLESHNVSPVSKNTMTTAEQAPEIAELKEIIARQDEAIDHFSGSESDLCGLMDAREYLKRRLIDLENAAAKKETINSKPDDHVSAHSPPAQPATDPQLPNTHGRNTAPTFEEVGQSIFGAKTSVGACPEIAQNPPSKFFIGNLQSKAKGTSQDLDLDRTGKTESTTAHETVTVAQDGGHAAAARTAIPSTELVEQVALRETVAPLQAKEQVAKDEANTSFSSDQQTASADPDWQSELCQRLESLVLSTPFPAAPAADLEIDGPKDQEKIPREDSSAGKLLAVKGKLEDFVSEINKLLEALTTSCPVSSNRVAPLDGISFSIATPPETNGGLVTLLDDLMRRLNYFCSVCSSYGVCALADATVPQDLDSRGTRFIGTMYSGLSIERGTSGGETGPPTEVQGPEAGVEFDVPMAEASFCVESDYGNEGKGDEGKGDDGKGDDEKGDKGKGDEEDEDEEDGDKEFGDEEQGNEQKGNEKEEDEGKGHHADTLADDIEMSDWSEDQKSENSDNPDDEDMEDAYDPLPEKGGRCWPRHCPLLKICRRSQPRGRNSYKV